MSISLVQSSDVMLGLLQEKVEHNDSKGVVANKDEVGVDISGGYIVNKKNIRASSWRDTQSASLAAVGSFVMAIVSSYFITLGSKASQDQHSFGYMALGITGLGIDALVMGKVFYDVYQRRES